MTQPPHAHRLRTPRHVAALRGIALTLLIVWSDPAASRGDALPDTADLPVPEFASDGLPQSAPFLFYTTEEVERARTRFAATRAAATRPEGAGGDAAIIARLIEDAEQQMDVELAPLDESWWAQDRDKPWQDTYPQVFQHTMREPAALAVPAATLATAWLITGEPRYADKAADLLMTVAPYTFVAEHYDVGMNFAVWGVHALRAYDILRPRFSPLEREHLDACFTRMAGAIARNDRYWIRNNIGGGINNHLAWHKMMLGLLGLFYGQPALAENAVSGPRSLPALLEDGLVDHGLWCESSLTYHFTAIVPMAIFADCQRRMGTGPALHQRTFANGRTLKQSFDAMIDVVAADGLIPPIGDSYGLRQKLWNNAIYEYAWSLWRDPTYAWLLNRAEQRTAMALFTPEVPKDAAAPPIRSMLLPEHGYAILRSARDSAFWDGDARMAFLTYDRSGVHSNADKLSLMLFGDGRMLLSDVEGKATVPHAFSSRIQRELNRGGLSQNTVMIDEQDQRSAPEMLELIEFRDLPDEKRVTAADLRGILYAGVRQMRTVAMTPDYVLDVFQVDCGNTMRQIDWIVHLLDESAEPLPDTRRLLEGAAELPVPTAGPGQWLRDFRKLSEPAGPISMGWRSGDVSLRLHLTTLTDPSGTSAARDNPATTETIVCGYPATDEPDAGLIPMLMARVWNPQALFAAIWCIGDRPASVDLEWLPPREGHYRCRVTADGAAREHLVPMLK